MNLSSIKNYFLVSNIFFILKKHFYNIVVTDSRSIFEFSEPGQLLRSQFVLYRPVIKQTLQKNQAN